MSGCQFYVWAILAFLGLALTVSLIFNIFHYIEKQRQDKVYLYSDDYIPRVECPDDNRTPEEPPRHLRLPSRQADEALTGTTASLEPKEDEYDFEDAPIYGNLDNVVPEPMDENCYEQMKARPERSVNKLQENTPPAQETAASVCYASPNRNCEGKRQKPKKQKSYLSDKDEGGQVTSLSKTTLVDGFSPESQTIEENIHDDPIRLFGLIRARKEL